MKSVHQKKKPTLQQKSHQRNKHLANPNYIYSGPFLKETREEVRQMEQRTRKLMTMHSLYLIPEG